MNNKNLEIFSDKENYIISLAIIELGGPYHKVTRFYNHLLDFHQDEFDKISELIDKNLPILYEQIPLILDVLYLMNEIDDCDFEVVCRNDIKNSVMGNISREDISKLCDKLEKIYKEFALD